MLSKAAPSTIFWVFGMTRPGIEPRSPRPLSIPQLLLQLQIIAINENYVKFVLKVFLYIYIYMYKIGILPFILDWNRMIYFSAEYLSKLGFVTPPPRTHLYICIYIYIQPKEKRRNTPTWMCARACASARIFA